MSYQNNKRNLNSLEFQRSFLNLNKLSAILLFCKLLSMRKETLKEIERRPLLPASLLIKLLLKGKRLNSYAEQECIEETTAISKAKRTECGHTIPSGGSPSIS